MDYIVLDVRALGVRISSIEVAFSSVEATQTQVHRPNRPDRAHSCRHHWPSTVHVPTECPQNAHSRVKARQVISCSVHVFYSSDPSKNVTVSLCQLDPLASARWHKYFHEVHLGLNHFTIRCLFSELIPTLVTILFNSYIVCQVLRSHHRLNQTTIRLSRRDSLRITSWMNIVLILHSFLFLASLLSHILGHFLAVEAHESWWVLLVVLTNCSVNFYVYCLSGRAFRNEIRLFVRRCKALWYVCE